MILQMDELWERLEAWLAANCTVDFQLNPPATEEALMAAEETLGVPIPRHLRLSFFTHDGQATGAHGFTSLGPLRSVARLVEDWQSWNELAKENPKLRGRAEGVGAAGAVKAMFWNPKWLPVTNAGIGEDCFVDLDPPRGGTVGQVIHLRNELAIRRVEAPSFSRWLTDRLEVLESGALAWSARNARFVPVAEARGAEKLDHLESALKAILPYAIGPERSVSLQYMFEHGQDAHVVLELTAPGGELSGDLERLVVPPARFGTTEDAVAFVAEALRRARGAILGGTKSLETIFSDLGYDAGS